MVAYNIERSRLPCYKSLRYDLYHGARRGDLQRNVPELPPHHGTQQAPSTALLLSPTFVRGSHFSQVGLTERFKGKETQEEAEIKKSLV